MKLLATLAAIRLDEDGDDIENTLSIALVDTARPGTTDRSIQSFDPLASSSWERVPEEKTLISPVQCKSLWRQFKAETEYTVTQAIAAQVSHKIHLYMCSLCAAKNCGAYHLSPLFCLLSAGNIDCHLNMIILYVKNLDTKHVQLPSSGSK
jgi:hypothetical protein